MVWLLFTNDYLLSYKLQLKKKNHFSLFELKKILLYKAKPLYIIQVDNGSMPFHIIVLYGFAQILQLWKYI